MRLVAARTMHEEVSKVAVVTAGATVFLRAAVLIAIQQKKKRKCHFLALSWSLPAIVGVALKSVVAG